MAKNIGVIVRGESSDGAIADGGYVYVGTDTCSEDTLWRFYNQVRGRDYIHLMFIKTLRYFGRRNIDRGTIEDILATMKGGLRDIQATGDLLGFRVGFNKNANSPEQLRLGRFTVAFQAEEPPVLRYIGIQSARYRPALDALLDDRLRASTSQLTRFARRLRPPLLPLVPRFREINYVEHLHHGGCEPFRRRPRSEELEILTLDELKLPDLQETLVDHTPGGGKVGVEFAVGVQKLEPTFKLGLGRASPA